MGFQPPVLPSLGDYRWSSYRAYAGYAPAPEWLETGTLLGRASRPAAERVRRYRRDVQDRLRQGGEATRLEALREPLSFFFY
jgi:hypothetical protein